MQKKLYIRDNYLIGWLQPLGRTFSGSDSGTKRKMKTTSRRAIDVDNATTTSRPYTFSK